VAVAAFYLIAEHRAHLLGWAPFLIFLACPLMHFMHGGHHHAHGHDGKSAVKRDAEANDDTTDRNRQNNA
jgi:hypothetical protein